MSSRGRHLSPGRGKVEAEAVGRGELSAPAGALWGQERQSMMVLRTEYDRTFESFFSQDYPTFGGARDGGGVPQHTNRWASGGRGMHRGGFSEDQVIAAFELPHLEDFLISETEFPKLSDTRESSHDLWYMHVDGTFYFADKESCSLHLQSWACSRKRRWK